MNILEIVVRPVGPSEETRYQELMQKHYYLGALPKIGETIWYVATWRDQWTALLGFSAPAWKCAARDRWIGWDFRHQYDRLKLLTNNSRFLILPDSHLPNLAFRVLALCEKRVFADWQQTFGHPVVLMETFVDPERFRCVHYAKQMKGQILDRLAGRTLQVRVGYEEIDAFFPEIGDRLVDQVLTVIAKAWDSQMEACVVCPTRCISERNERAPMFDDPSYWE
jgi:hypothetical protein